LNFNFQFDLPGDFAMNMNELSTLPLAQRLEAMEVLWESLSRDSAYDPSPDWHADVLAQRVREIDAGQVTNWPAAKARIFDKATQLKNERHA
jgi:Putative addiction module component